MEDKINLLISQLGDIRVKRGVNLKDETRNSIFVVAPAFYIATTERELVVAVQLCHDLNLPFLIIGSGSKLVLDKKLIEGLVIKNRSDSLKLFGIKGKVSRAGLGIEEVMLEAGSGAGLQRLAEYAKIQKLNGFGELENATGTVGGSILSNHIIRDKTFQVKVFSEYQSSEVKSLAEISAKDVIISVTFKLKSNHG